MSTTIGSLFSGIGGLELGLERAGLGPVVWQAEQDPFCRAVLRRHWPEAKRYRDVREVDEHAERPEIICGGFPCQDISLAGTGKGLAGARSGLWSEFARIIRVCRPRVVVIENVPALRMRGLCEVLRDLAACGYDAEWDCIPAQAVGAPHRRDRLFVVAHSDGWRREGQWVEDQRSQQRASRDQPDRPGLSEWPPSPDDMHAWRRVQADAQPAFCRVADGVPDRAHRLRALGNAVVPAVAEVIGGIVREMMS